jgi:aldehyde dehydrogenase (NAD+)
MEVLGKLGIAKVNLGIGIGNYDFELKGNNQISSLNPATEKDIAKVTTCELSDYQSLVVAARKSFEIWRNVPAPKRGDIIRQIADALRIKKMILAS